VRVRGSTFEYVDWRDHIVIDRDAAVLAWRQGKGRRLGHENSHEALAWNVFRSLERAGLGSAAAARMGGGAASDTPPRFCYWGRDDRGTPCDAWSDALAALHLHLKGPDINGAESDVMLLDESARAVLLVDVHLTAPIAGDAPLWFLHAHRPPEQRRRRAIVEALCADEPDAVPFRRGLAEVMARRLYGPARRLLLARAVARRLGPGWRGLLVTLVNAPTVRGWDEDSAHFNAQLTAAGRASYRCLSLRDLFGALPPPLAEALPYWQTLAQYAAQVTANGAPAQIF
jgi:hypothetical protein